MLGVEYTSDAMAPFAPLAELETAPALHSEIAAVTRVDSEAQQPAGVGCEFSVRTAAAREAIEMAPWVTLGEAAIDNLGWLQFRYVCTQTGRLTHTLRALNIHYTGK